MEITLPNLSHWRSSSHGLLHCAFLVHVLLMTWSMLGFWSGNKLLIHHVFFLLCLMWTLHERGSTSPVSLALLMNVISIVLDIIVLACYYPHQASSTEQFSAIMAIFNLGFRLVSIVLLYNIWNGMDLSAASASASSQPAATTATSVYGSSLAPDYPHRTPPLPDSYTQHS